MKSHNPSEFVNYHLPEVYEVSFLEEFCRGSLLLNTLLLCGLGATLRHGIRKAETGTGFQNLKKRTTEIIHFNK